MKKIIIKSTELLDNTTEFDNGKVFLSAISVYVEVEIDNKIFKLEFQTTEAQDYGAISTDLKSSAEVSQDHSDLIDYIDDYDEHEALFDAIKDESAAQEKWDSYVNENFIRNDEYFGGVDANSEINEATRKP